jgi:hypothetical protein
MMARPREADSGSKGPSCVFLRVRVMGSRPASLDQVATKVELLLGTMLRPCLVEPIDSRSIPNRCKARITARTEMTGGAPGPTCPQWKHRTLAMLRCPSNTGDKLRSSILARLRLLHPLVLRHPPSPYGLSQGAITTAQPTGFFALSPNCDGYGADRPQAWHSYLTGFSDRRYAFPPHCLHRIGTRFAKR